MNKLIQAIVALAFFLQALIPLGFMPNAHASSQGTALVICSGLDTKTIYVDDHGKPVKHEKSSSQAKPCLYSGMTAFNKPELLNLIPVPVAYSEPVILALDSQVTTSNRFLLPQAIGPPSFL